VAGDQMQSGQKAPTPSVINILAIFLISLLFDGIIFGFMQFWFGLVLYYKKIYLALFLHF